MADIAARLGVSRQLVSIALRGLPGASSETRERVQKVAEELSYRGRALARRPRQHRPPARRLIPPRPGASIEGHYSLLMDGSDPRPQARPTGPFRAQCAAEISYPSVTNCGALAMPPRPPLSRARPGIADRITRGEPRRSRLSVCRAARDSIV